MIDNENGAGRPITAPSPAPSASPGSSAVSGSNAAKARLRARKLEEWGAATTSATPSPQLAGSPSAPMLKSTTFASAMVEPAVAEAEDGGEAGGPGGRTGRKGGVRRGRGGSGVRVVSSGRGRRRERDRNVLQAAALTYREGWYQRMAKGDAMATATSTQMQSGADFRNVSTGWVGVADQALPQSPVGSAAKFERKMSFLNKVETPSWFPVVPISDTSTEGLLRAHYRGW